MELIRPLPNGLQKCSNSKALFGPPPLVAGFGALSDPFFLADPRRTERFAGPDRLQIL